MESFYILSRLKSLQGKNYPHLKKPALPFHKPDESKHMLLKAQTYVKFALLKMCYFVCLFF